MPTYRLIVEYDGSKFAGWQVQPKGRTVQGVLTRILRETTGHENLTLLGAGRTDAGVHALAQVASIRTPARLPVPKLLGVLAKALPPDLAVLEMTRVPDAFHPRHDAVRRSYRYQIARRRSAFGKRFTWWVPGRLDATAMQAAAVRFVGRHDFAAFARRDASRTRTIVVVEECRVADLDEVVLMRIAASHFLWSQARRMVGALVAVGRGEAAPTDVERWLTGAAPPPALAAPAAGLFLEAVHYPGEAPDLPPLLPIGIPWRAGHRPQE
jgi:tRNA pseudouridine38-40 synthase